MSQLLVKLQKSIIEQLHYRSIRTCTEWSKRFRVMGNPFPGPFSVDHHPWTREMMDWNGDWCGPKSAQMGYTEAALNRCFYTIDILKTDVVYLLPKQEPDAKDFSSARFTPALELSPHLKELFTEADNIGYKRAGAVSLYVRGMQSRSGVKSFPAGVMIFDELDEMPPANIELASHRTAGQLHSQNIKISTPTIPEFGVDAEFQVSTKEHYFFKCPRCSRYTELSFPECIVITAEHVLDPKLKDSHYICKECKGILDNENKIEFLSERKNGAEWVKTENFDSEYRGFHINRMYSMAAKGHPTEFAKSKLKADRDPTAKQEFYNSVLGKAYVVDGARVMRDTIERCLRSYSKNDRPKAAGYRVMGIDVGTWLHYEIGEYHLLTGPTNDANALSMYVQLAHGTVPHFEDLDPLMREWQILASVIDANPERRKAREFACRFPGHVYLCFYSNGLKGNEVNLNEEAGTISVDRTNWLDAGIGRFNSDRITLPKDTMQDYKNHVHNLVRKYERDASGNPVGVWVTVGGEDHFGHARTYAEIALPLALKMTTNRNIENFL